MKIVILMEGQTEIAFIPALREFISSRLPGRMPKLVPQIYDGRIPKEQRLRRIVENHLRREADAVIALTDVYTGTRDFVDAADAKAKMRQWVGDNPQFYPHVAQHDFEAWLLSGQLFKGWRGITKLFRVARRRLLITRIRLLTGLRRYLRRGSVVTVM